MGKSTPEKSKVVTQTGLEKKEHAILAGEVVSYSQMNFFEGGGILGSFLTIRIHMSFSL